jgi:hypothetical protein
MMYWVMEVLGGFSFLVFMMIAVDARSSQGVL